MPKFSNTSKERLSTCHADLQTLMNDVIRYCDISVIEGHRSAEDQNKYYAEGKSKVQYPNSRHNSNPSMAIDVVPYPTLYTDAQAMVLLAGWVLCTAERLLEAGLMSHKVRWGGDWDGDFNMTDQRFNDYPHFELFL